EDNENELSQFIEKNPMEAKSWCRRASFYRRLRQWSKAAADYGKACELEPNDIDLRYRYALTCYAAEDLSGYQTECKSALQKFGEQVTTTTANTLAWICVLGPNASTDVGRAVELAETAVRSQKNASSLSTFGAATFRSGNLTSAIELLNEALHLHESC